MTSLIFTHGRWHKCHTPENPHKDRQVCEQKNPEPGDTFSELSSPLGYTLRDLKERGLDANTVLKDGTTWLVTKDRS